MSACDEVIRNFTTTDRPAHLVTLNISFGYGLQLSSWYCIQEARAGSQGGEGRQKKGCHLPLQNWQVERILGIGNEFFQICLAYTTNWVDVSWGRVLSSFCPFAPLSGVG